MIRASLLIRSTTASITNFLSALTSQGGVMRRSKFWSVLFFLPVFALLMGARVEPLVEPDPIAIPQGVAADAVRKAVRAGLLGRGWLVNEEKDGRIVSTLNLRKHTAKVEVTWDNSQIRIKHLESTNLKEDTKNGQRVIHRNYIQWLNNLVLDISRNVQMQAP
jgi:hypothetical protein